MDKVELLTELSRRNHNELYHSCTVPAFISYCISGGYRSRHTIEKSDLKLTEQYSDGRDKEMGIYDCLFLNIFDIHDALKSLCFFGPVLLVFDAKALEESGGEIKSYRKEISSLDYDPARHEIAGLRDLCIETFSYGAIDLPNKKYGKRGALTSVYFPEGEHGIQFNKYLKRVVIDRVPRFRDIDANAKKEVEKALEKIGLARIPVETRDCGQCGCSENYSHFEYSQIYDFFYRSNEQIRKLLKPESLGPKPITKYTRGMIEQGYTSLCAGCGIEREVWEDLINRSIYLDCPNCGFEKYSSGDGGKNICPYCGEGVYFSEEEIFEKDGIEDDDAIKCSVCGTYCHIECADEDLKKCVSTDNFRCNNCH
jgi:hypothetical protein